MAIGVSRLGCRGPRAPQSAPSAHAQQTHLPRRKHLWDANRRRPCTPCELNSTCVPGAGTRSVAEGGEGGSAGGLWERLWERTVAVWQQVGGWCETCGAVVEPICGGVAISGVALVSRCNWQSSHVGSEPSVPRISDAMEM